MDPPYEGEADTQLEQLGKAGVEHQSLQCNQHQYRGQQTTGSQVTEQARLLEESAGGLQVPGDATAQRMHVSETAARSQESSGALLFSKLDRPAKTFGGMALVRGDPVSGGQHLADGQAAGGLAQVARLCVEFEGVGRVLGNPGRTCCVLSRKKLA